MNITHLPPTSTADIHPANRITTPKKPLITPQNTPEIVPLHISPFASKVNELPPKERSRAYSTSSRIEDVLENEVVRTTYRKLLAFRQSGHLPRRSNSSRRTASTPIVKSPGFENTLPQGHRVPIRPPARLIVSAPPISQSIFSRPVPASPMGNAWSGEHYWAPQFSPQVVVQREESTRDPDDLLTLIQPVSRAAYYTVRDNVQALASKLANEAEVHGETIPTRECDVIAAERVLDDKNAEFARGGELPLPRSISSRIFELAGEESRAISSFGIKSSADLLDIDLWMRIDENTLQFSTILDSAKEALAMLKERRKSRELELSVPAYSVVYALRILDEKRRKLKRGSWESEISEDDFEYGMFLKSIQEELVEEEKRREGEGEPSGKRSEGFRKAFDLENRRLKGKAPSVLDLATWAEELRKLEGDKEEREEDEIGRAITKDD